MSASTLRQMASAGTMGAAELIRRQQAAASTSTSGSGLGPQPTASIKQPPMAGKYQPPPASINPVQPAPVVQQPQTAAVVATVVPAAPHAKAMNEDEPHLVVSPPSTSKLASLGGVKGTAQSQSAETKQPKDAAENGSKKGKKRSKKEEESDDEEEEASGDESSGDSSSESGDSGSESDGSSSGEEDDDDDSGSESEEEEATDKKGSKKRKSKEEDKKKKTTEKKATKGKKDESKKPKKGMEKAKKTKPLKPTHESTAATTKEKKGGKKSKKEEATTAAPAAAAEPEPKSYPYTPELTPPIRATIATEILAERKPHTKEQEAEIEKDENSNHTHCADMVAKGYTLIHSASYSISAVSFRKDAAEKAEAEEANKKKSSSEDGVPASDKGRGQVAITSYIKALSESPYEHFDVWWNEEKNRAYIACTFRVAEFLAQNPKIDGPDAYCRVRCVLGKVHARLARSISQRPSRSPNSKRTYYTNTIFNEKSFGADKDLGTTAENPKWVPEPLWSSDQIKAELKAVADDATKKELRKQEQEMAEAHEEDKRRERVKEEEKSANKKRAKEEEKKAKEEEKKAKEEEKKTSKQVSKKSRTETAAAPAPAPVAMMVDIVQHHLCPSSSLISMLTKQQQELSATIAQLTVAIDSAKAAFNTNHALLLKVQGTSAQ